MPFYPFKCEQCGQVVEEKRRIGDFEPYTSCLRCGGANVHQFRAYPVTLVTKAYWLDNGDVLKPEGMSATDWKIEQQRDDAGYEAHANLGDPKFDAEPKADWEDTPTLYEMAGRERPQSLV